MKLTKLATISLTAATLAFSSASHAAIFNFAQIADTEGEAGFASYTRTEGGVTVTATGTDLSGGDLEVFAYLDSGNAGLGVCKTLTSGDQCTPSNDDNVTLDEMLTLVFDTEVTISEILFRDAGHGTGFGADPDDFAVRIDNGSWTQYALTGTFSTVLFGTTFDFVAETTSASIDSDPANSGDQLYINALTATATVPEPASLLLLGLGLAGLGFRMRR